MVLSPKRRMRHEVVDLWKMGVKDSGKVWRRRKRVSVEHGEVCLGLTGNLKCIIN